MVSLMLTEEMADDVLTVGLEEDKSLTRGALHLLGTLAHAVAFASSAALHFTGSGNAKALFRPAVGPEFGHFLVLGLLLMRPGMSNSTGARRRFSSGLMGGKQALIGKRMVLEGLGARQYLPPCVTLITA
jgi:hypothetical protein